MQIALIATYELGRQPFGLASPAAWLAAEGHQVACIDLSVENLPENRLRGADLVAFHLPMHTATRLAVPVIQKIRQLNPRAHLCCFGLYAPLTETYLRKLGIGAIFGGEFEQALVNLAARLERRESELRTEPLISIDRLQFLVPDRSSLPALNHYSKLRVNGIARVAGYTEASRGCKHRCRHCPIVPVYNGQFRIVQADVVLEDVRRQVAAGAEHISFGDPDFLNGPTHAVRIIEALHREFPLLTYDATIKIEHLRTHRRLLPILKETGCLFVTTAVESVDDAVLHKLEKGHTRADFIQVAHDFRETGLILSPTFIPFTPWTSIESYRDLLAAIDDLDLVEHVSPIQLALRLLIPAGSRMLELDEVRSVLAGYDEPALLHGWKHPDPAIDSLAGRALKIASGPGSRREIFTRFWELVYDQRFHEPLDLTPRTVIPYMDEPWYC